MTRSQFQPGAAVDHYHDRLGIDGVLTENLGSSDTTITNVVNTTTFVTEVVNNQTFVTELVTQIFQGAQAATYVTQLTENNTYVTNTTTIINANITGKKGIANELATLDGSGKLTASQIPSTLATDAEVAAGYQPLDSDLTAIAALSTTSFGRSLLAQADAAAARTTLGLDLALVNPMIQAGDIIYTAGGADLALNAATVMYSTYGTGPQYAFDGNDATSYHPNNGDNNAWLAFDCGSTKTISGYRVKRDTTTNSQTFQGSPDGTTWTTLHSTPLADSGFVAVTAQYRYFRTVNGYFNDIFTFSVYEAVSSARLPKGTDGQVLKMVAGYPAWATA